MIIRSVTATNAFAATVTVPNSYYLRLVQFQDSDASRIILRFPGKPDVDLFAGDLLCLHWPSSTGKNVSDFFRAGADRLALGALPHFQFRVPYGPDARVNFAFVERADRADDSFQLTPHAYVRQRYDVAPTADTLQNNTPTDDDYDLKNWLTEIPCKGFRSGCWFIEAPDDAVACSVAEIGVDVGNYDSAIPAVNHVRPLAVAPGNTGLSNTRRYAIPFSLTGQGDWLRLRVWKFRDADAPTFPGGHLILSTDQATEERASQSDGGHGPVNPGDDMIVASAICWEPSYRPVILSCNPGAANWNADVYNVANVGRNTHEDRHRYIAVISALIIPGTFNTIGVACRADCFAYRISNAAGVSTYEVSISPIRE
jgi:hypothetical protein